MIPSTASAAARETDEQLVEQLARRDDRALRELHRRHAPLVFAIVSRVVSGTVAEEVVQDVFVTLWTKHASFDPTRGPLRPWLIQVARRHALNALRRTRGEPTVDGEALDAIDEDAIAPDEAGWRAHRRAIVRAAVDTLPDAQRRALSLAFFDELTHEQVAAVLGTSLGTTKTRIRGAIRRLGPVLVAALATVAVAALVIRHERRVAWNEEALRMVTASDVVPLRLAPSPDAPPEAHGNYRTRPGARVAVLTTSHLAPPAAGSHDVAWSHDAGGWRRLGVVKTESDGRSLLVLPLDATGAPPDDIRVTVESSEGGDAPGGTTVLRWTTTPPAP